MHLHNVVDKLLLQTETSVGGRTASRPGGRREDNDFGTPDNGAGAGDKENSAGVAPSFFVPYRASKLTLLLQGALGGRCRTTWLCCVASGGRVRGGQHSTVLGTAEGAALKLCERVRRIRNSAQDWE